MIIGACTDIERDRSAASYVIRGLSLKHLLNLIGIIAVVLAFLGVFLPLLPTTPFLLLASFCFARGSTRLHRWLLSNPVFGKYLSDWEQGKGLPMRAKIIVLTIMWISMGYAIFRLHHLGLQCMLAVIGIAVTTYLVRFVPTYREDRIT